MTKAHGEMSGEEGIDVDGGKMSRRKQSRPQHIASKIIMVLFKDESW